MCGKFGVVTAIEQSLGAVLVAAIHPVCWFLADEKKEISRIWI